MMPKPLRGTAGAGGGGGSGADGVVIVSRCLPSALRYIAECEGTATEGTTLPVHERNKISHDDAYHAGDVLGFSRSRPVTPDHGQAFRQGSRSFTEVSSEGCGADWSTDGALAQPATVGTQR